MTILQTFARRVEGQRRFLGVGGSLVLHASVAALFVTHAATGGKLHSVSTGPGPGAITISLIQSSEVVPQEAPSGRERRAPAAAPPDIDASGADLSRAAVDRAESAAKHASDAHAVASNGSVAPALAGGQPSGGAPTVSESDYQRRLLEHVEPYRRYPGDAARAGIRGVVQLVFEINREGDVLDVWIARSSGSQLLDAAAMDTVRRAAPFPAIPANLPDAVTIQLPVNFNGHI